VLNAPSPAATASLSIGDAIAERVLASVDGLRPTGTPGQRHRPR
jgi:hypothetical protein